MKFIMTHFNSSNIVKSIVLLLITLFSFNYAFGATWTDNGSYSITWYDKNQSEFEISTPEQLAGVAYLVNNNFTNFSGKTLIITSDINLVGKSWTPIGMGSSTFQGSIEGNNHSITNITIIASTAGSPYASGMWIKLANSTVKDLHLSGDLSSDINNIGFIASTAESCTFENITVNSTINYSHPNVRASTGFQYSSKIGGMIGTATSCSFSDVEVNSIVTYTFGSSNGNNCYGNISLYCGGIVADGSSVKFERCHAINNHRYYINGYVTTSTYTNQGDSFITYGGLIGSLSNSSSQIIGCLVENNYFLGEHSCGTFDTKYFRFGGIVGHMSKYDSSILKNCVAMNDSYNVSGHSYSWQASWYHTNSYFGGVAYESPKNYAGCYSNNDVIKNISQVEFNKTCEDGSTSFSRSQMNTQSFVEEVNFYSQLSFDKDFWELKSGKLSLKKTQSEAGIIETPINDNVIGIYNLNGEAISSSLECLTSGIYIVKYPHKTKKIVIK